MQPFSFGHAHKLMGKKHNKVMTGKLLYVLNLIRFYPTLGMSSHLLYLPTLRMIQITMLWQLVATIQ